MSTTEEYLDGLLQETMGQKESDAKTAQPDITKKEKNAAPTDDNHKMSPDEIAALFAQMQGDPEPAAEPEPVVAPQSESVEDQEDTTESQQLEPVSEQEPVAEAPKEEKVAAPADDNHKMSPDEIAALFAQMQGDSEPAAEPALTTEQEPEVRSEEKPAEIPVTEAAEPEAEPEPVEEVPKEEPITPPADDNHKMSPDEIAALFAQMQGNPEPAAESEPVNEAVEETTEIQQPESVSEQEPVAEAPKEEPITAPADDNHKMSPDEIAALFAQMQGDSEPTAEPAPAAEQEPEVRSEEKLAEIPVTEAAEPEAEPESVEEAPKEEEIAAPADDNHKMSPDEIAALFAQMQGDPEPEPVAEPEPAVESEAVAEPEPTVEPEAVVEPESAVEIQQPVSEPETESGEKEDISESQEEVQSEESDMSDELSALLKEIQAEPDEEEQPESGEDEAQHESDAGEQAETETEEKLPPQEEMEIDLSDPDAMSFLQEIREKEEPKESQNEDEAVNEIEELLRKSDNHEMVSEELDLPGEQDALLDEPTERVGTEQSDEGKAENGDKSAKKKKGLFSFFGKKKKKQEDPEQQTDDILDAQTTAEREAEAAGEESEPVADGDVHDLLQDLFDDEGSLAGDSLQKEETAGEQISEAADIQKEKKESFWKKLGNVLFEEDEEEIEPEGQEPEKKKKDKKGKKKKKVTDASDNQGILEELDAEGADGKKGKKKKKDKKKPKKEKKALPKEGTEKEEDSKKLPTKMVVRIFILAFSILALLLIVVEIIPSMWTAADARNAFYKKEYRTAYEEMTGKKLSKKDQRLYEKARLVASMQQRYDAYTTYTALQMPVEALDSLLSGYLFWQQEADAITEYDATTETDAVKYQILNTLYDTYQLTEDDVRQINALDDYDYTVKLEELTGSLSHKNSNAQQAGSANVTGDADTTAPTADSLRDGTQTEPASDAADMTQMQDILPEEEME